MRDLPPVGEHEWIPLGALHMSPECRSQPVTRSAPERTTSPSSVATKLIGAPSDALRGNHGRCSALSEKGVHRRASEPARNGVRPTLHARGMVGYGPRADEAVLAMAGVLPLLEGGDLESGAAANYFSMLRDDAVPSLLHLAGSGAAPTRRQVTEALVHADSFGLESPARGCLTRLSRDRLLPRLRPGVFIHVWELRALRFAPDLLRPCGEALGVVTPGIQTQQRPDARRLNESTFSVSFQPARAI